MSDTPLRVAFDVTPVISGRTGIARYVTQVGEALERTDVELRRFAIGRSAFPAPLSTRRLPVPAKVVYGWWRALPWPPVERLFRGEGDPQLVHATGPLTPATRLPLVVTVHDIAAVRHPELHPARHVRQQRSQLGTLNRAAAILTVSQATADDLAAFGVAPERLVVAPLGISPLPPPAPVPDLDGRAPYLLTVGETAARKGYGVLLAALARLDPGIELVMAGPPAGDEQRLTSLAAQLGIANRLRRLGPVSDAALAGLYRGALALCFPSIAEGFGLPLLEAMVSGTPIIASDIPPSRELAGPAAIYVANDAAGWADAIAVVASDDSLRRRLAAAGRERGPSFTWERTAARTEDAYRLALANGG